MDAWEEIENRERHNILLWVVFSLSPYMMSVLHKLNGSTLPFLCGFSYLLKPTCLLMSVLLFFFFKKRTLWRLCDAYLKMFKSAKFIWGQLKLDPRLWLKRSSQAGCILHHERILRHTGLLSFSKEPSDDNKKGLATKGIWRSSSLLKLFLL